MNRKSNSKPLGETLIHGAEKQKYCDLCGEEWEGKFYGKYNNYQILLCNRCGLIWVNPLKYHKVAKEVKKSITSSYWAEEVYLSGADSQKKRFRKQLEVFFKIKKVNMSDLKSLKLLEVGSGLGFFLDVCEEFGIMAEGCDISERAVTYANQERERVRLGTLDDYYENETFDVVFAFNLIEHLTRPKHFFIQARRVLKLGGLLVLETPIQESLAHKLVRIAYLLSKNRLNFLRLVVDPGGHIYSFSKRTFEFICDDMGFRNLYQRNINSPFGEIWGKSSIVSLDYKAIFRFSIPIIWAIAKITGQENRLFIILQKL